MNIIRFLTPAFFRFIPVLLCLLWVSALEASSVWRFGSADGRDADAAMVLVNTSTTNGNWTLEDQSLRFENRLTAQPDDNNFTEALALLDLSEYGYRPGSDFTLWMHLRIQGVWEWNRLGLVAFLSHPEAYTAGQGDFLSARMQILNRGAAEVTLANDFTGRRGERTTYPLPERLTNDEYRLTLVGQHQPDGNLRLTFSLQRDDDDTPYTLSDTLTSRLSGTYFGFGGRLRAHRGHQPRIDLIEMRYDSRPATLELNLPDPITYIGVWQFEGKAYRYRATLRRAAFHDGPLAASVLESRGDQSAAFHAKVSHLLEQDRLVLEFNSAGLPEDEALIQAKLIAFREAVPALLRERSEGLLNTESGLIELPFTTDRAVVSKVPESPDGLITLHRQVTKPTPGVLAYNMGHFFQGSNARDWWRYSGATGARAFINPGNFESPEHRPEADFAVNSLEDFLTFRELLSADPENPSLANISRIRSRFAGDPIPGWNRITVEYAFRQLSEISPDILVQANVQGDVFPVEGEDDWNGKWRMWRSYFSMVYYYASEFGIQRFSTHNEPNHPLMLIDPDEWLMRAAICADAAARAIEAVNRKQGTQLEAMLFVPVTAGDLGDPFTGPYQLYGRPILERWDLDFMGERTGKPLYANYAIQRYNARPDNFGRNLLLLKNRVAGDLPWDMPMPSFSITEFNVHHGRFFDSIEESMDSPSKFLHFAGILTHLLRAGLEEFYVFKFGLTRSMPGRQFLVHKNGMFYTDNHNQPHNYGGPTRGAEVYRLFTQAFSPGRTQLALSNRSPGILDLSASHDPETNDVWIFSINEQPIEQSLDLNLSAWAPDLEGFIVVAEVSDRKGGEVVLMDELPGSGEISLKQPAESVWLIRLPSAASRERKTILAHASAGVKDDPQADLPQAETGFHRVDNPPSLEQPRAIALYAFDLPSLPADSLQSAVLALPGKATHFGHGPIQAQVFLLSGANWDPSDLKWSEVPGLKPGVSRGHFIQHRVVDNRSSGPAQVLGQINVSQAGIEDLRLDLTEVLANVGGGLVTVLVAQEPRWDNHPSDREAKGDMQPHGLLLEAASASDESGPRIDLLIR